MTWSQLSHGSQYDYAEGKFIGHFTVGMLARSLAGINRYNAWTNPYWSVASHACLVAEILAAMADYDVRVILAGLHHDDHETITGDITTPIKQALSDEARIEILRMQRRAQRAIEKSIGIPHTDDQKIIAVVKEADIAALESERRVLFSYRMPWATEAIVNPKMLAAGERIMASDFAAVTGGEAAAIRFINHHHALVGRM